MSLLYVHKVFPHDISHEVGFTQEIHYLFFNNKYYLTFTHNGGPTKYSVTVNDATDLRFGGSFKSLLPTGLSVGDYICIEKLATAYNLKIAKASSTEAARFNTILGARQRHIIFENGKVIYKR